MALLSRRSILPLVVVLILLAATPSAIQRVIETGNLYLFTDEFFRDMTARFHGPGRFRFVFQPIMAILLGTRDGKKDSQAGRPPFLRGLALHGDHRWELFKSALSSVSNLVAIAILLDLISQYLIFGMIRPGAALILGPVLIAVPYSLSRALMNRIVSKRSAKTTIPNDKPNAG